MVGRKSLLNYTIAIRVRVLLCSQAVFELFVKAKAIFELENLLL